MKYLCFIEVCLVCLEQGYDPFKPEVVRHQIQQNGKPGDSGDLSGALELVNRAIEEVRGEVEREKRKLSCIGDEPYDPSESTSFSSSDHLKSKTPHLHLAYDPGSYQMTTEGYTPSPGCSKYTLDSDTPRNNSNSMEYVPTLVKKPRTHAHPVPSPPHSPKYSNSTSSSKCKYTVDISRPSTDMEYDPLSNYSAGIATKNKRDKDGLVKVEGSKTYKLPGSDMSDDDSAIVEEKPQHQSIDPKKYTVSESDGESSGTEYRPTSLSNLQQRKANSGSLWDALGSERREKAGRMPDSLTQKNKGEVGGHTDVQEGLKRKESLEKKKMVTQRSQEKSGKVHKFAKVLCKISGSNSGGSSSKEKQHYAKKENKNHARREDWKKTDKVGTSDKGQSDKKRTDFKSKTVVKAKTDPGKQDKHMENGAKESKKAKVSDNEKELGKNRDCHHKNGKLDSNKREMNVKKISRSSNSRSSSANSKDKMKQAIHSANGKRLVEKRPSLNLSHAELFGDESPDEAEPSEVDDEEPEEMLVRKSADAFRRRRPNKRKASELTPSSSDDEGERVKEGSRASENTVASLGIDFSGFQDDLDFESDPMEECLRIFNESKDVKKEDKGRQAKQVEQFFLFQRHLCGTSSCGTIKLPFFVWMKAFPGFRGGEKHREHFNHSLPWSEEESLPFCCQRICKFGTLTLF